MVRLPRSLLVTSRYNLSLAVFRFVRFVRFVHVHTQIKKSVFEKTRMKMLDTHTLDKTDRMDSVDVRDLC